MWEVLAGNRMAVLLRNALGRRINCWSVWWERGPGAGPRSGASSLFLDQNEVRGVKKNYFGGRPPSFLGVWMSGLYLLEDPNIRPVIACEKAAHLRNRETSRMSSTRKEMQGGWWWGGGRRPRRLFARVSLFAPEMVRILAGSSVLLSM